MPTISAVVPVFNAAQSLEALYRELTTVLNAHSEAYEIILVEDCGRDNSWQVIESISASDQKVRGIRLSRNYGQHNALLCGIREAQYELIVTLDDDLQNPPSEIPRLLEKLNDGLDVVYGAPARKQHGFFRNIASSLTKMVLQTVMGAEAARNASAFRLFRTRLRNAFTEFRGPFVSIDVMLTWGTCRFGSVVVDHHPRVHGSSNYSFRKLLKHAIDLTTGFSSLPLRFASLLGFCFTIFGLVVLFWVIGRYLLVGTSIPGFPFLASIIAIFSGAQLFALGIFGEYLARIHFRTMDRPSYVINYRSVSLERNPPVSMENRGS